MIPKVFETNHLLNDLCKLIGVKITNDQECTLELLSELVVWSGRYPIPKNEGQWNNYHDVVQEKHILHEREGKVGKIFANRDRFPTLQNYLALWAYLSKSTVHLLKAWHNKVLIGTNLRYALVCPRAWHLRNKERSNNEV